MDALETTPISGKKCTDVVVSLLEDPEDILSTTGIFDEEPTMSAVGDRLADNTSAKDEDPSTTTHCPTLRSGRLSRDRRILMTMY